VAKRKIVEKPFCNGEWSRARFFSFVRSALRKASQRWAPIRTAKLLVRVKYSGPNKRMKWLYRCADCGGLFGDKNCSVDHIEECGSLRNFDDLPGFVKRLFCEVENLRVLCGKCHTKRHEKESDENA